MPFILVLTQLIMCPWANLFIFGPVLTATGVCNCFQTLLVDKAMKYTHTHLQLYLLFIYVYIKNNKVTPVLPILVKCHRV